MGIKIALCQEGASANNVDYNLNMIMGTISQNRADIYVFPELFLSGYGADYRAIRDDVENALNKIKLWCSENDIAIVVGTPMYDGDRITNSVLFVTQARTYRYDKLYLAKFGIYAENEFTQGNRPVMAEFKGMKFGLSICYDIFFPEIFRHYSKHGADVNICVSASAKPSRPFLEKILPARSLENVIYTVYVNNVGNTEELEYYGHSRLVGPLGDTLDELEDCDEVRCVYVDRTVIANARKIRHHMSDFRTDIGWI